MMSLESRPRKHQGLNNKLRRYDLRCANCRRRLRLTAQGALHDALETSLCTATGRAHVDDRVRVMFRTDRKDRDVLAVMPDLPNTATTVTAYAHIGQHHGAHWSYVLQHTRPATPDEYAPLLAELRQIGYNVVIAKRR